MKVLLEVELPNAKGIDDLLDNWFPYGDDRISIDEAILKRDPEDDSFFLFTFKGVS